MKDLTRADLLERAEAVELRIERLELPGFGGAVYVKEMTGKQRDNFEQWALRKSRGNIRGKAAARCLVTAEGVRLFADDDAPALGEMRASVLQKIWEKFQELNGLTDDYEAELGEASGVAGGADLRTSSPNGSVGRPSPGASHKSEAGS